MKSVSVTLWAQAVRNYNKIIKWAAHRSQYDSMGKEKAVKRMKTVKSQFFFCHFSFFFRAVQIGGFPGQF